MTQQRNRLQSGNTTTVTTSSSTPAINVGQNVNTSSSNTLASDINEGSSTLAMNTESTEPIEVRSTSSFANLLDGFTSRVSGDRSQSAASTPSSNSSGLSAIGVAGSVPGILPGGVASVGSISSLTSIGNTANAFYSSIGLAFNSLTSPITAAAAAASATTAEAAAVVVAAASAISNHLSSPTSTTPPRDLDDEDEDCEEDGDEEDVDDRKETSETNKKSWTEMKATVNEIRRQVSNLSSMVPTNIQFRTLSDGRVRCYFLSTPPNAWETTLLYTDINVVLSSSDDELISPDSPNESGRLRFDSPPSSLPTFKTGGFMSGSYIGNLSSSSIKRYFPRVLFCCHYY